MTRYSFLKFGWLSNAPCTLKVLPELTAPLTGVVHTLPLGEVVSCLHTILEWPVGALGKALTSQLAADLINELLAQGLTHQSTPEEHTATWWVSL